MTSDGRNVALLLVVAAAGIYVAFLMPGDLFFDFGPNDFAYVSGFREDFEVDEPTIIHWTTDRADVTIPFRVRGPYVLTLRYKRHVAVPAEVHVFAGKNQVASFVVPQQDFALKRILVDVPGDGPLVIGISSSSLDRRPLGIALDWMAVSPSGGFGSMRPDASVLLYLLLTVTSLYLVPRLVGVSKRASLVLAFAGTAAVVALAISHKLWPAHAALTLGLRPHVIGMFLAAFFRWRSRKPGSVFALPLARWVLVAVFVGMLVRLFALFHPDFYYPDVRTHSKFVSLIWTEGLGGFFSNHIENQHRHLLGLQLVGDEWRAFPYPPLLYLLIYPLSLLRLPVDDWMKIVPTALLSIEALVVFAVAIRLGIAERAAAIGAALHATAPLAAFRLAVASYAALFGHFWDVIVVAYLVFFYDRLNRFGYGVGLAALIATSILSYAGSALVLGLFVPALAAMLSLRREPERDVGRAVRIALFSLAGALSAIAMFYLQYLPELLPSFSSASPSVRDLIQPRLTPLPALEMAFHRLNLFYGPVFGTLFFLALPFLRGRPRHPLAMPVALASVFTFLALNFLRSGLGETHIFQFTKDDLVLLPVAVMVLGTVVDELARRPRILLRAGALALTFGWLGWGMFTLAEHVRARFIRPDYPPPPHRVSAIAERE